MPITAVQFGVVAFSITLSCIWSRCATTKSKNIIAVNEHNEPFALSSFLLVWQRATAVQILLNITN